MNGDLISRGKLLEDFRNTITEQSDIFDWLNMIARQPVVCNLETLVEQIKNMDGFEYQDEYEYERTYEFNEAVERYKVIEI